ncbi:MAG: ERCC4 domain-containing protein [Christensenellales bacterium]
MDSREKTHAIQKILATFERKNIDWFVSKLPVGDYMSLDNPRLVIDRKRNLTELCGNVCQQLPRFRAELIRANECGIKLIILCEHGQNIKQLSDVIKWNNPRLKQSPLALSGERLYKKLRALSDKYNVNIVFCNKNETGNKILELLNVKGIS